MSRSLCPSMSGFSESTFAAPDNFGAKGLGSDDRDVDPYCHNESTMKRMITNMALGPVLETGGEDRGRVGLDCAFSAMLNVSRGS